jgi:hypothetical protein
MEIVQGLIGGRAAIGVCAYMAPKLTGRLFGLNPAANPQAPYLGRLFGVRDAALAYGLATSSAGTRGHWLKVGIACDLGDAVAGILAGRSGQLPKLATVLVTTTAFAVAAAGVAVLLTDEPTAG